MKRALPIAIPGALLLILACNLPSAIATPTADAAAILTEAAASLTGTAALTGTPAATASATATTTATASPTVTAAGTSAACNLASFVSDVTVPDDTVMDPNESFTKTWRLKNAGTCAWTSAYQLVFASGDQMGGPDSKQLTSGSVAAGATVDVSVDLKAPAADGTYKGNWQLREPGGTLFALSTGPFWVQIKTQSATNASMPDWPIRKSGQSGIEVEALQRLLVTRGEVLTVDGVYGPITKSKVQHFQSTHGLSPDGIVGPLTWPKLIVQVKQGSHSEAVRAVQGLLNTKFGYSLSEDAVFGPDTDSAVRDFQSAHSLSVDGIVGPNTWQVLIGS